MNQLLLNHWIEYLVVDLMWMGHVTTILVVLESLNEKDIDLLANAKTSVGIFLQHQEFLKYVKDISHFHGRAI